MRPQAQTGSPPAYLPPGAAPAAVPAAPPRPARGPAAPAGRGIRPHALTGSAPAYLRPATGPPPGADPPPYWAAWGGRPGIYNNMLDGSWVIYPYAQYGLAGDDSATVNEVISQLKNTMPNGRGLIRLPALNYNCQSTILDNQMNYFVGSGRGTVLNYSATGDCFRVFNPVFGGASVYGGGIKQLTVDGTNAGPGSNGIHLGDLSTYEPDCAVQNFSGAGSAGVLFDNQIWFTEETHGYLWLSNCATHLAFNVGGALTSSNSFGYSELDVQILAKQNQDGIALQNGALFYNSPGFKIRGNFQGTPGANTSAVLRITGQIPAGHPDAGGFSAIHSADFDLVAECNSATGPNAPQTIAYGDPSGNQILGCTGVMDFAQGTLPFAVTNWTALGAGASFGFMGVVRGDFNLNNATVGLSSAYSFAVTGPLVYGKALLSSVTGNMQVDAGDSFQQTLAGNITVTLNPGGAAALGGAQTKLIYLHQPTTGGVFNFTVTWPSTATPTVTNCTILWPGGVAPTMPAGAGATMRVQLDTYDGATWYGSAQNMS
jgi:hypothetical protein